MEQSIVGGIVGAVLSTVGLVILAFHFHDRLQQMLEELGRIRQRINPALFRDTDTDDDEYPSLSIFQGKDRIFRLECDDAVMLRSWYKTLRNAMVNGEIAEIDTPTGPATIDMRLPNLHFWIDYPDGWTTTIDDIDTLDERIGRLEEAIKAGIDMIENCAGVPTEPDSLPQMLRVHLKQALEYEEDESETV